MIIQETKFSMISNIIKSKKHLQCYKKDKCLGYLLKNTETSQKSCRLYLYVQYQNHNANKKHSENADTSMSVTFDLEL